MAELARQEFAAGENSLSGYARELSARLVSYREEFERTNASALIFGLESEYYALPTSALREVVKTPNIHSIPRQQGTAILGLANYRGELLLCVSLKSVLALTRPPTRPGPSPLMLVIGLRGVFVGCPVDRVLGVHRFRSESIRPCSSTGSASPGLVLGILDLGEKVASVLGADAILSLSAMLARHTK